MPMPDLSALLGDDEPTAEEAGRAMAAALRRKQDLGLLATLSGGRLAPVGQALTSQAGEDQQALLQGTNARATRTQARTAADLRAMEALRKVAEDKRDFEYRQQHDTASLAQQDKNAQAQLALAGAGLGLRTHEVAMSDAERVKNDADKQESQVRELAAKVGENPAMISEKMGRVRAALTQHGDDVPGFGRVASYVPDSMVSDEGRDIRGDARELVNTLLFLQSGAGVSNQERENKYNSYGVGKGASIPAFKAGMSKLENDLAVALKAKQAGFKPETVSTYKERGGVVPSDIKPKAPVGGAAQVAVPDTDARALAWAKANPTDRRAVAILKEHGL